MRKNFTKSLLVLSAMLLMSLTASAGNEAAKAAGDGETVIYSANFLNEDGGFTTDNSYIWKRSSNRGWQAYGKGMSLDANLTSEEFDLSNYSDATLSFTQIASQAKNDVPSDVLHVEILEGDKVEEINDNINWPDGSNVTPVASGDVSLNKWAGKKIKVQFHYTCTTVEALIWAINDMKITGKPLAGGIENVTTGSVDLHKAYEIYSLGGARLNAMPEKGVVIVKQGGRTFKIVR